MADEPPPNPPKNEKLATLISPADAPRVPSWHEHPERVFHRKSDIARWGPLIGAGLLLALIIALIAWALRYFME